MKIKPITLQATRLLAISTLTLSFASQATLVGRDLDGNLATIEAVYDDVLNITWLANANLAASNSFGVTGVRERGEMNWYTAENFISAMNTDNGGAGYLGVNIWRQSSVAPINGSHFNGTVTYDGSNDRGYQISAPVDANNPNGQSAGFTGAELAYHYYNNLGGVGYCSGIGTSCNTSGLSSIYGLDDAANTENLGLFSNIANALYWTGKEVLSGSSVVFTFYNSLGYQNTYQKGGIGYVWAVADGDVGASIVPVPAAMWLFLSALGGLFGLKHRARSYAL